MVGRNAHAATTLPLFWYNGKVRFLLAMSRCRVVRIPHPERPGYRYDVERRYTIFFWTWEWIAPFDTRDQAEVYAERLQEGRLVIKEIS
jgi:hypothetical protein